LPIPVVLCLNNETDTVAVFPHPSDLRKDRAYAGACRARRRRRRWGDFDAADRARRVL